MASCKDCVHYEACDVSSVYFGYTVGSENFREYEKRPDVERDCGQFKDRNRFVELPCKIGDTVYVKTLFGDYAEAEVRDYSYFISCGFCVVVTSTKFDKHHIPFSKFGKTVFLTREEAEQALKERENNG